MPVVVIYGVPGGESSVQINGLFRPGIREAIADIPQLKCTVWDIDVHILRDITENHRRENIDVVVKLYEKPERTEEVLNTMCEAVIQKVKEFRFAKVVDVDCYWEFLNPKPSR
ncbi:hypothetical protein A2662_01880 [Candidatus Giovannonibacteria bacterium RIFCSPHIGHO2_01_FULL_45_33]|uniref:Uncharacterized protein n=1 Tax=Candidatus Giovannonibacteria bacterium RIFCSPLOWO2_01_FULL_45_34 TaxID=1798351 RepID=A0A1F5X0F0_9BACT|nr:MAG: hypothetical protein A2662_01880 [Candidatus Giovannonibacteria bacterium RIFCSPHIGHO2_01_FULL_45_33]OGF69043.1 MAG: hypothetical protein A3C73_00770 [Candidatus Giovannonibacteria bacterium RIFCSPHIGHO2_02_FULL_44_11]OGF81041.1 MAG: hypothetical protein A2930_03220 [Candidatus Giovannonibacteria bacterium RIFCSPLOWO2_01_FULL_45_34]